MIVEFPARQWKRTTLFDLMWRTDSTGSATQPPGSSRRRTFGDGENYFKR